ncbi:hypothetical protein B0H17DRAFT_510816 [Mycena rosella]|uniref:F-box domain-containing protein n=1 Tax=Mycena rosella TaxID=1033263 RepID=A0AAD7BYC1_MYCRO|nr:hypothetical protein B0H17DRAFT_510816 [Mycena rosella]
MLIENLPVELVLILLRGSPISDILSFTRTSSYFRCISLANRRLWMDAFDSYRIQLPLGDTLKTTDLSLLPRNAVRSMSIARKWRHPELAKPIAPIRTYEATRLYDLPAWAFWAPLKYAQPSFMGHAPPAFMNVLPGGRAFLCGSMGHLGIYDLRGRYGYELDVPFCPRFDPPPGGSATTVSWDSVDNGAHITVGVLSKSFNERRDLESKLSVFALDYARTADEPSICRTHVFTLPIYATAVYTKGPLVLVHGSNTFLLVNLQTKQCGCWLLQDTEITAAEIDPALTSIFLVVNSVADNARSLQIFDVPPEMEPFEQTPFWACYEFAPRTRAVLADPLRRYPTYPTIQLFDSESETFREATLAAGGTLLLSSTVTKPRSLALPRRAAVNTNTCTPTDVAVLRSAHRRQMLAVFKKEELAILPSAPADDVLRLAFPAGEMPGAGRALAFDDVYGIMLVFARGRLFVVQY